MYTYVYCTHMSAYLYVVCVHCIYTGLCEDFLHIYRRVHYVHICVLYNNGYIACIYRAVQPYCTHMCTSCTYVYIACVHCIHRAVEEWGLVTGVYVLEF